MARQLSERETSVLKAILACMPHGATGSDLTWLVRELNGNISPQDITVTGCHRTAASLCRKNLAWRAGTSKLQFYKITQTGRNALKYDQADQWVARNSEIGDNHDPRAPHPARAPRESRS